MLLLRKNKQLKIAGVCVLLMLKSEITILMDECVAEMIRAAKSVKNTNSCVSVWTLECQMLESIWVLLVWIITEVVTHNPKSACICICSLDTRQETKRI